MSRSLHLALATFVCALVLLSLVLAPGASAVIAQVGSAATTSASSADTRITVTTTTPTAGNTLVAFISWNRSGSAPVSNPIVTIQDDGGNAWSIDAISYSWTLNSGVAIAHTTNIVSAQNLRVVTTFASNYTNRYLAVAEYTGIDAVNAFVTNNSDNGSSTTISPGSVTVATSGSLVLGAGTFGSTTSSPAASYSWIIQDDVAKIGVVHQIFNSTGATTPSFTQSSSTNVVAVAAVFQPGASLPINRFSCVFNASATCANSLRFLGAENDTGGFDNAHVERGNSSVLANSLCCSAPGTTLSTTCGTPTLHLNGTADAHIEQVNGSLFSTNACFSSTNGTFACTYADTACPAGYACVLSFSSADGLGFDAVNAHVGRCPTFTRKLCCVTNTPPTHTTPILNATDNPANTTSANLTLWNQSTADAERSGVTLIASYKLNSTPIALLLMPFDSNVSNDSSGAVRDYARGWNATLVNSPLWTRGVSGGAYVFGNDTLNEPQFHSGSNTMLWNDTFENYTSDGSLAGNYSFSDASVHMDGTGGLSGSRAVRYDYTGFYGSGTCPAVSSQTYPSITFPSQQEVYAQVNIRETAGAQLEWDAADSPNPYCSWNTTQKDLFTITGNGAGGYGNLSMSTHSGQFSWDPDNLYSAFYPTYQNSGRYFAPNDWSDGNWHRVTMHAKLNTTSAPNGFLYVWIDGELRYRNDSWGSYSSTLSTMSLHGYTVPPAYDYSDWYDNWQIWNGSTWSGSTFASVPNNESLQYTGGSMTAMLWMKPSTTETDGFVLSKPWNARGEYNYRVRFVNNSVIAYVGGDVSANTSNTFTVANGTWTHIAVVYGGGNIKVYRNGSLQLTQAHSISSWTPVNGDAAVPFTIGNLYPNGTGWIGNDSFAFNGTIDDVRVYNRSLTVQQIYEIYSEMLNQTNRSIIVSQELRGGDIWCADLTPNDGALDGQTLTSNNVTIFNSGPTVPILITPTDNNITLFDRYPYFNWTVSTNVDGFNVTYYWNLSSPAGCAVIPEKNVTTNSYTSIDRLCVDKTYNWTVKACDVNLCSAYATPFSFMIPSVIGVTFVNASVNFGTMLPSTPTQNVSNATLTNNPYPLKYNNTGNVVINTSIRGNAALWSTQPLNTSYFEYADENSSAWQPINTTFTALTGNLSFGSLRELEINVTVPQGEPATTKNTTLSVLGVIDE